MTFQSKKAEENFLFNLQLLKTNSFNPEEGFRNSRDPLFNLTGLKQLFSQQKNEDGRKFFEEELEKAQQLERETKKQTFEEVVDFLVKSKPATAFGQKEEIVNLIRESQGFEEELDEKQELLLRESPKVELVESRDHLREQLRFHSKKIVKFWETHDKEFLEQLETKREFVTSIIECWPF